MAMEYCAPISDLQQNLQGIHFGKDHSLMFNLMTRGAILQNPRLRGEVQSEKRSPLNMPYKSQKEIVEV